MPNQPGERPTRRVLPLALAPVTDGDLAAYFEGLANPTRLRIVQRLAEVERARVSDMALQLGISQPRMSWHLRLLRRAHIVNTQREGREVFCRLDRESIAASLAQFTGLLAPSPVGPGGESQSESNQPLARGVREQSVPEVLG